MKILKIMTLSIVLTITTFCFAEGEASSSKKSLLCIAEKAGQVVNDGSGGLTADSGIIDDKYLVTPDIGFRKFGVDAKWLSKCNYDENGRPIWCEYPGPEWAGTFILEKDNTFVLSGMNGGLKKGEMHYYWLIGRCSSL